jgi:hypothetical protein
MILGMSTYLSASRRAIFSFMMESSLSLMATRMTLPLHLSDLPFEAGNPRVRLFDRVEGASQAALPAGERSSFAF